MRKSSVGVSLGLTAVVAASLTGCSSDRHRYTETKTDYGKVCRDTQTNERVSDDRCERHGSHMAWWFIPLIGGRRIPAVGSSLAGIKGGVANLPKGRTAGTVGRGGGNFAKSGTVSRGGFGGSGGGSGS